MNRLSQSEKEIRARPKDARTNHILSLLSEEAYARLAPHLEPVHLEVGQVIYRAGQKRNHAYFPTTCLFALQQFDANNSVGCVGMVGKEGMLGLSLILQNQFAPRQAVVQSKGDAWRIAVEFLEREFFRGGELMHLILRMAHFSVTQTAQRVVCSQHHQLEQKVCDWLTYLQDISEPVQIQTTQTQLAELIGVRRQGISEILNLLKANDLLEYRRGRITLTDQPRIKNLRCGCHALVAQEYKRLFSRHLEPPPAAGAATLRDSYLYKRLETLENALAYSDIFWFDANAVADHIELGSGRTGSSLLGDAHGTPSPTMQEWDQRVHPDDQARREIARETHMKGEAPYIDVEYRIRHRDGHWIWVHGRGKVVESDTSGKPMRQVGCLQDITARKQAELALEKLTRTDYLTQAANRRHFFEQGEREVSRALRYGSDLSLLSMDLDHFKHINDKFGHAAGDLVLQNFASVANSHLRLTDVFARLGGEEFCLLLPHTDSAGAQTMAQRILESVRAQTVASEGGLVRYTVSLGISSLNPKIQNLSALLKASDLALYRAKGLGRDRVEFAVDR
jgi:diguanylate cyclase (GGDEF)-like protein